MLLCYSCDHHMARRWRSSHVGPPPGAHFKHFCSLNFVYTIQRWGNMKYGTFFWISTSVHAPRGLGIWVTGVKTGNTIFKQILMLGSVEILDGAPSTSLLCYVWVSFWAMTPFPEIFRTDSPCPCEDSNKIPLSVSCTTPQVPGLLLTVSENEELREDTMHFVSLCPAIFHATSLSQIFIQCYGFMLTATWPIDSITPGNESRYESGKCPRSSIEEWKSVTGTNKVSN